MAKLTYLVYAWARKGSSFAGVIYTHTIFEWITLTHWSLGNWDFERGVIGKRSLTELGQDGRPRFTGVIYLRSLKGQRPLTGFGKAGIWT